MGSNIGGALSRRRGRKSLIATTVGLFAAAAVLIPSAAMADPSPSQGPTAGGTTVSDVVPQGVQFVTLEGGDTSTVALGSDGRVYAWGNGFYGQIGNGANIDRLTPTVVSMPAGVTFGDMSVGSEHVIAVGSDGLLYSWGNNSNGQLGDGTTTARNVPTLIATPPGVVFTQVEAGSYHSLALTSDGAVYAWGGNNQGQLGDGSTTVRTSPVPVQMPAGVSFSSLAAGEGTSAALTAGGVAYSWGSNFSGSLGDGTNTNRNVPTPVQMPAGVTLTSLSAGGSHMVATGSTGTAYTWGYNGAGQLGDGTLTDRNVPGPVTAPGGVEFETVSATTRSTIGVTADGTSYSWGQNSSGQLGDGTTTSRSTPAPILMPAGVRVVTAGGGASHSVAQGSDGNTYSWGNNTSGQLGDGTTTNRLTPALVNRVLTVTEVTFGGIAGTNLTVAGGRWNATTPPGCGPVDVTVTWTLFGTTSSQTYPNGFTYGTAPIVTAQPASATITAGGSAALTAAATGDNTPTVQWQSAPDTSGPWTDVPGATSETLDVTPATTTHYRAVFSNCNGQATTDAATMTVTTSTAPLITTESLPSGTVNHIYTTKVEATGTGPITFAVTGGTLPSGLTLDPATGIISGTPTTTGAYSFTITASNDVGADTHDYTVTIAQLAIVPPVVDPKASLAITGGNLPWILAGSGVFLLLAGTGTMLIRRINQH